MSLFSTLLTSDLEVDVEPQVIHHREAVQRLADVSSNKQISYNHNNLE
jgi:hypothetical protein